MANDSVISDVDAELKPTLKVEIDPTVSSGTGAEANGNQYESIHSKSPLFYDLYERKSELQNQTHYCPGCGHGVVHKLIAEALQELGCRIKRSS